MYVVIQRILRIIAKERYSKPVYILSEKDFEIIKEPEKNKIVFISEKNRFIYNQEKHGFYKVHKNHLLQNLSNESLVPLKKY